MNHRKIKGRVQKKNIKQQQLLKRYLNSSLYFTQNFFDIKFNDFLSCQGYTNQCQLWTKSVPATEDVLRSCGYANAHCEVQEHAMDLSEKQMKCKSKFKTKIMS